MMVVILWRLNPNQRWLTVRRHRKQRERAISVRDLTESRSILGLRLEREALTV